jgi:hypothetical protein
MPIVNAEKAKLCRRVLSYVERTDGPPNAHAICGDGPQCLWPLSAEKAAQALEPFADQLSEGEKAEVEHALNPPAHVQVPSQDECYS